jgi:glutamate-5-semialdehyde dehydrogenase
VTTAIIPEVLEKAQRARQAATRLAALTRAEKDRILLAMAEALEANAATILAANARDVNTVQEKSGSAAPIDRLLLNGKRVAGMADALRAIAGFTDPIGEVIGGWRVPNGLEITKVRVPLGVIGIIYESRPNVTVDSAGLCLKSGNAVILRGGSDAIQSNLCLVKILTETGEKLGLPKHALQILETTDREAAGQLMRMDKYVDVLIPRGGHDLIQRTKREATIPVIETGEGNCHVYVDLSADLDMAELLVVNAKCQRPTVCNAAETLLVHQGIAAGFLPRVGRALAAQGVELRACDRSLPFLDGAKPATEEDWYKEYLALILAVKVVDSVDDAIAHINTYGTRHSEAIVTRDLEAARRFTHEVDAAAVYVNASTRFTDGGEFGLGAEIGISNQKLHARGPMGLAELTSYKYVVMGEGHIRS